MENKLILLNEPINLGNQLFLASFSFPNLTEFGGAEKYLGLGPHQPLASPD